jgi:hypothetical protein
VAAVVGLVQGLGFRVQGSGFRFKGSGFRIKCSWLWVLGSLWVWV